MNDIKFILESACVVNVTCNLITKAINALKSNYTHANHLLRPKMCQLFQWTYRNCRIE